MNKLYQYRKENGLCVSCGDTVRPGSKRCLYCQQIRQVKTRLRYEELKEKGICVICETRKAERGVRCNACYERAIQRQNEYRKIHPRREYRKKEA